jgi:hypothetical protein
MCLSAAQLFAALLQAQAAERATFAAAQSETRTKQQKVVTPVQSRTGSHGRVA